MTTPLRIAIVGLDTSHAEQFTLLLNEPSHPNHVPGARVTAAYPKPSLDLAESRDRVEGFTAALRDKFGVPIASNLAEACRDADAIMLLALDGRPRLALMQELLAFKKPVFMDKPVAASLEDVVAIYRLAAEEVPVFSASAIRWWPGVQALVAAEEAPASGAISYGPAHVMTGHPDLYFYGIHPTEALLTVMGTGCVSVTRTTTASASVVTGLWQGGRAGTLYAVHEGAKAYKLIRFGRHAIAEQDLAGDYAPLLSEIVKFFRTGQSPVSVETTLEVYAFMEAAEESKRRGGAAVSLREVLVRAAAPSEWLPALVDRPTEVPQATVSKGLPMPGSA